MNYVIALCLFFHAWNLWNARKTLTPNLWMLILTSMAIGWILCNARWMAKMDALLVALESAAA